MFTGKYVFAQLVEFLPQRIFDAIVNKYDGNRYVKHFTCWNQLLAMMFGQLTNRESLRDLIVAIDAHSSKCYHLGFGKNVTIHPAYFVIRAKRNLKIEILKDLKRDNCPGIIISDHLVRLDAFYSYLDYPENFRRVRYYDVETRRPFTFLTNNMEITAEQVALLYKNRWQIELFFKWIKQHLKIKSFWGTSENAVRIQVCSAIITYCLVAIVEHDLKINRSTYEVLQVLGISLLDKTSMIELFNNAENNDFKELLYNQQLSLNF